MDIGLVDRREGGNGVEGGRGEGKGVWLLKYVRGPKMGGRGEWVFWTRVRRREGEKRGEEVRPPLWLSRDAVLACHSIKRVYRGVQAIFILISRARIYFEF